MWHNRIPDDTGCWPCSVPGSHYLRAADETLRQRRQRQDERRALTAAVENDRLAAEALPHALSRSAALFASLKAKRFAQIFSFLASSSVSFVFDPCTACLP